MNNRETYTALVAAGMHRADAYDLLADSGADPHVDAPIVEIGAVTDPLVKDPDASVVDITARRSGAHRVGVNRGGRPRIGRTVDITLPEEDIAWLDGKAREFGISRAETIRRIIDWWRDKRL